MIDQATVERIIETARIDEVISEFVNLKKAGSNLKGLCPFHQEKTPSFMVSPAKGIYKCFGCHKGGNVVNFVMEQEGVSYPEALRWIARRYNIEIAEAPESTEDIEKRNARESLYIVNDFAVKYFTQNLFQTEEGVSAGLSYLRGRGFRDDIIKLFELGYAPVGYDNFHKAAIKAGYKPDILERAFLVKKYDNRYSDFFHSRIMFPIHNVSGRAVGFTGRVLGQADSNAPKYLNTHETEIFFKGKVLYGLHLAKKEITRKGECILVEGNADVVMMYQAGFENVVAGSGTALTIDQVNLIKRFTKNVLLIYDSDTAGINAAIKNADTFLSEGFETRIVMLPKGEDPDSFTKGKPQKETEAYFESAKKDFISFKIDYYKELAGNDPLKISSVITQVIHSIALVPDNIQRAVFIRECSKKLEIEESVLYAELQKEQLKNQGLDAAARNYISRSTPQPATSPRFPVYVQEIFSEPAEREILRLLVNYGNKEITLTNDENAPFIKIAKFIIDELKNDELEFKNLVYKKVFTLLSDQLEKHGYIDEKPLINHEDVAISELVAGFLTNQHELSKLHKRMGVDTLPEDQNLRSIVPKTIISFKFKILEEAVRVKRQRMKQATEHKLPADQIDQIMKEIKELNSILMSISKILKWVVPR
jgi:DNA primase